MYIRYIYERYRKFEKIQRVGHFASTIGNRISIIYKKIKANSSIYTMNCYIMDLNEVPKNIY